MKIEDLTLMPQERTTTKVRTGMAKKGHTIEWSSPTAPAPGPLTKLEINRIREAKGMRVQAITNEELKGYQYIKDLVCAGKTRAEIHQACSGKIRLGMRNVNVIVRALLSR